VGAHGRARSAAALDVDAVALARFVGLCQDEHARNEMNWLIDLISGVRSVRAEMNVPPPPASRWC